ncbi:hypothetical protein MW887_003219 [Aspergillus wentii]|nr:hypothetical protein MW887_003219 [Aspergillus wentii]
MSQYEEWFSAVSTGKVFDCNPRELTIFRSYLDANLSPAEAAEQLTAPAPPQWNSSFTGRLWTMILFLAKDYEEAHDDLVALVQEFFTAEPGDIDWAEEKKTYLPESWRATYDYLASDHSEIGNLTDPTSAQWVNYNAFTARLLSVSVLKTQYWALRLVVDALEKKVDLTKPTARQDGDITAAAQYFIHAAKDMLENELWNKAGSRYTTTWGDESQLWHGEKGLSLERWTFWKTRFGEMRVAEGLS